jgi:hypothetical protein
MWAARRLPAKVVKAQSSQLSTYFNGMFEIEYALRSSAVHSNRIACYEHAKLGAHKWPAAQFNLRFFLMILTMNRQSQPEVLD